MIALMMAALAAGQSAPLIDETVYGLGAATENAGACGSKGISQSAVVRLTWGVSNANTGLYSLKVYRDGIYVATLAADATLFDYSVSGVVENGSVAPYTVNWTFRVDVVRQSDNLVVSSSTAATFTRTYGQCPGGPGQQQ